VTHGQPAARPTTVHVAVPELTGRAEHPAIVTPDCLKSTVPVAPVELTVAVKVTDCPTVEGFVEDASVVVVGDLPTEDVSTKGASTGDPARGFSSGNVSTGDPTGGVSIGGVSTGGVSTGGVSTGCVSTGGVSTGGVSTGSISTGCVSTGGVSTGGVSTGSISTGGVSPGVSTGDKPEPPGDFGAEPLPSGAVGSGASAAEASPLTRS
jgi:hypothetical protein